MHTCIYNVRQLSSRTDAIKLHEKDNKIFINTIIQHNPCPLQDYVYIILERIECPKKCVLLYRLQFSHYNLLDRWHKHESRPITAMFNLGNENKSAAAKWWKWSGVDGFTRGSLASPKLGDNIWRMHQCIVVQKMPWPIFLKLRPNEMNQATSLLITSSINFAFTVCTPA
jgi:hypothetical protein